MSARTLANYSRRHTTFRHVHTQGSTKKTSNREKSTIEKIVQNQNNVLIVPKGFKHSYQSEIVATKVRKKTKYGQSQPSTEREWPKTSQNLTNLIQSAIKTTRN